MVRQPPDRRERDSTERCYNKSAARGGGSYNASTERGEYIVAAAVFSGRTKCAEDSAHYSADKAPGRLGERR